MAALRPAVDRPGRADSPVGPSAVVANRAFQATDKQIAAWRQAIAKMPETLRAGPDFIVGSALVARQPEEGALWLLRGAILYPRERQLAAAGLAGAAAALDKLDRHEEAQLVWSEIVRSYADQALLAKEAQGHLNGAACVAPRAGGEENHEPADARFLAGLRRRGLFALAETDCRKRLEDPQLDEVARAELVIDLVRTLADMRLAVPADSREPIWQEISSVTTDFQRQHPHNPACLAGDACKPRWHCSPARNWNVKKPKPATGSLTRPRTCRRRFARRSSGSNSSTTIWPAKSAAARGLSEHRRPAC